MIGVLSEPKLKHEMNSVTTTNETIAFEKMFGYHAVTHTHTHCHRQPPHPANESIQN